MSHNLARSTMSCNEQLPNNCQELEQVDVGSDRRKSYCGVSD